VSAVASRALWSCARATLKSVRGMADRAARASWRMAPPSAPGAGRSDVAWLAIAFETGTKDDGMLS
jgi:hypothetical protein